MFSTDDWHFLLSLCDGAALHELRVYRHDLSRCPEVPPAEDGDEEREQEQRAAAFALGWALKAKGVDAAVDVRTAADAYYANFLRNLHATPLECKQLRPGASQATRSGMPAPSITDAHDALRLLRLEAAPGSQSVGPHEEFWR